MDVKFFKKRSLNFLLNYFNLTLTFINDNNINVNIFNAYYLCQYIYIDNKEYLLNIKYLVELEAYVL